MRVRRVGILGGSLYFPIGLAGYPYAPRRGGSRLSSAQTPFFTLPAAAARCTLAAAAAIDVSARSSPEPAIRGKSFLAAPLFHHILHSHLFA